MSEVSNEVRDTPTKNKPKRTYSEEKSFVRYIHLLVRRYHSDFRMQYSSKEQLDRVLKIFSVHVRNHVNERLKIKKKNTVSIVEMQTAVLILFPQLGKEMVKYSNEAVIKYENYRNREVVSIQTKSAASGIIFNVGMVLSIIRKDSGNIRVSVTSPIFLAASLEYLTKEILKGAVKYSVDNGNKLITPKGLYYSVNTNDSLREIFDNYGIHLVHTGTLMGINTGLLSTVDEKKKNEQERMKRRKKDVAATPKVEKKSLPGDTALKEIKKLQSETDVITTKNTFKKLIKMILRKEFTEREFQLSGEACELFQIYIEDVMTFYFRKCISVASYSKRKRITDKELYLVYILDELPRGEQHIGYTKSVVEGNEVVDTHEYRLKKFITDFYSKYNVTDKDLEGIAKASIKHLTRRSGSITSEKKIFPLARVIVYKKLYDVVLRSAYSVQGRKATIINIKDVKGAMSVIGVNYTVYKKNTVTSVKKNTNDETKEGKNKEIGSTETEKKMEG